MLISKFISFNKIEIYFVKNNEEIYGYFHLKNLTGNEITIKLNYLDNCNPKINTFRTYDDNLKVLFSEQSFKLEIFHKEEKEEINFNFTSIKPFGFKSDSKVESRNGKIDISKLRIGEELYDNYGNFNKISTILIFYLNSDSGIYPIKVKKNSCGLLIPRENFTISVNSILKLKKIKLFGRQLYLSKKAIKENISNDYYPFYNLIINNNKDSYDFFINGFISSSFIF